MPLSNKQKITFLVLGLIILILVLGFLGVIPGIKKSEDAKKKLVFTLNVWLVNEDYKSLSKFLDNFRKDYPKGKVNFRSFQINNLEDYKKYENALLNALAEGRGPDIFMIKNGSLLKYINKIYPAPFNLYNFEKLKNDFPYATEQALVYNKLVYGLPLTADTLVLIYNKDLFAQTAYLEQDLKTWQDLLRFIENIPKDNEGNRLFNIAIGGDEESIATAGDIFYLLLLQKNGFLINKNQISLKRDAFDESLIFYKKFTDFLDKYYTWNDNLNYLEEFYKGKTVIIFDYYSRFFSLKEKNINLGVLPMLQENNENKVNLLNYWFFVVSRQSKNKDLAWDFVIKLTTNESNIYSYLNNLKTKLPIYKKILVYQINNKSLDPDLKTFLAQILTAKDVNFDLYFFKNVFSDFFKKIKNDKIDINNAYYLFNEKILNFYE